MKKLVSILSWCTVFFTTLALILTILTTHRFFYVSHFEDYYTLQWCIFFTMAIWAVKLFDSKSGINNKMYPIMCIFFAAGTMFFIFMKVY